MANKKIKKQSFMQGILALIFSQVLIKILGLGYKWYLTNKEGFGDKGNAIYSAGFSIYALLLTISSTGVPNAVAKLVAENIAKNDFKGAHRVFKIAFGTFAIIGLIGTLLLFLGASYIAEKWLNIKETQISLIALSPSIFFVSIISVFRGYFNGREDLKATANSQTIEQLFKTVFTIIVVEIIAINSKINTNIMAAGANFATTLATITSFSYLYRYYKIRKDDISKEIILSKNHKNRNALKTVRSILSVSIPMSLSAILTSVNRNIDSMTVKRSLNRFLSESESLKQYGILSGKVDTLINLPLSFNIAFATALVPAIATAKSKGDIEGASRRISFSVLITILIGLPATIGMMIFADPILQLLFPNAPEGKIILQISSIAIIFMMIEQTINGALQGLGKITIPAMSLGVGVAIKLVLNIVLVPIPKIGVIGAAIATVICHITACCISYNILRKTIKLQFTFTKIILKPLFASAAMGICSYGSYLLLKGIINQNLITIIAIIIALLVYILSIIILKIFTKEEIFMLPYGRKLYKFIKNIRITKNGET